ncbi:MAG: DeoR/GlpR transcriptional regulator [Clostridia bacterium]|nr:DeoR/GlpR transcriptional regulator [Clostridia bacterium]
MAQSNLKIDIRRGKIMDMLRRDGKVYVAALSRELGATPVTIRNDLAALERDGYLVRMAGGAVSTAINADIPTDDTASRLRDRYNEKKAIAKAVAELLCDGDTLFINSGSTTQCIAAELKMRRNLNIVTNSLAVATTLGTFPTHRVILLGGEINSKYGFTYGGDAQEQLNRYKADFAILSIDSISTDGITTYHAEEAIIDRMMISAAGRTLIAADYTKLGHAGFTRVCECTDGIELITNACASESDIASISAAGVKVIAV